MKTLILSERGTFYLDKMRQCFQCKAKPNPQLAWKQVMPLWFHQQSKGQQKQKSKIEKVGRQNIFIKIMNPVLNGYFNKKEENFQ